MKYLGLTLFFIGLAVFIGTVFAGPYRLTEKTVQDNFSEKPQQEAFLEATENLRQNPRSTVFGFVAALEDAYPQANQQLGDEQKIPDWKTESLTLSMSRASLQGGPVSNWFLFFMGSIGLGVIGAIIRFVPLAKLIPGIKNHRLFHKSTTSVGIIGIAIGTLLISFYLLLYFFPAYLSSLLVMINPIFLALKGSDASQWDLYGLLYTLAIVTMGIRFIIKYRHSKYQMVRTASVMFFQTAFAFMIPQILASLNLPAQDLKNMWPLDYGFFFEYRIDKHLQAGTLGIFMFVWGVLLFVVGVPVLVYFFGKRWYCSWVCGCGGLAETAGDPFRHLSNKKLFAWNIERYLIHGVLVFAVVMTASVIYHYMTGDSKIFGIPQTATLGLSMYELKSTYGFAIGAIFSGVVGTGFYPLMGNRVWCRFGCPLAAWLGIVQRFKSRFRITTNGGQCISCGNCSTYCEMGIDVRWYAQRGQNIVRSSCVGCGICSAVCPRGVLNLENKDEEGRLAEPDPILLGNDSVSLPDIQKQNTNQEA